jgi:hypothetical protein
MMAEALRTSVMDNLTKSSSSCASTMISLPLQFESRLTASRDARSSRTPYSEVYLDRTRPLLADENGHAVVRWIMEKLVSEYDTYMPMKLYR